MQIWHRKNVGGCKQDNQSYNHHFGEHLKKYSQYIFIYKF
jgi:hypothetical protein